MAMKSSYTTQRDTIIFNSSAAKKRAIKKAQKEITSALADE